MSIKSRHSACLELFVSGAYGFDLGGSFGFPMDSPESAPLSTSVLSKNLNGHLLDVLAIAADWNQTFHLLRHSLVPLLKFLGGIAFGIAHSILSHGPQSIIELYRKRQVCMEKLAYTLRSVFWREAE